LQFADGVYDINSGTFTPGAQVVDVEAIRADISAARAAVPERPATVVEPDGSITAPDPAARDDASYREDIDTKVLALDGKRDFVVDLSGGGRDPVLDLPASDDRLGIDAEAAADAGLPKPSSEAFHELATSAIGDAAGWPFQEHADGEALLLHPGGSVELHAPATDFSFTDLVESLLLM
jgi:hypothetical protein